MATLTEFMEHNEKNYFYPSEALKAYYENADFANDDVEEIYSSFVDSYAGCYDDLEAYAYELLESTGELSQIPETLRHYFDYASFARDLEFSGDVWTHQVGFAETFVFRSY